MKRMLPYVLFAAALGCGGSDAPAVAPSDGQKPEYVRELETILPYDKYAGIRVAVVLKGIDFGDEGDLRKLLEDALGRAGFEVVSTDGQPDAVLVYQDVVYPGCGNTWCTREAIYTLRQRPSADSPIYLQWKQAPESRGEIGCTGCFLNLEARRAAMFMRELGTARGLEAHARPSAKTAVARSARVSWPDLGTATTAASGTRDSALIVAVEEYAYLTKVAGAVRNGQDWYKYLTQSRKVPASRTRLLVNAEATDFAIRTAAQEVARSVQPGGTAWFIFIGHGAPNQGATDGLLVAADAQQTVDGLENRSVAQSAVLGLLAQGQGTPVAIIDACYSGRRGDGQLLVAGLQPSAVVRAPVPTGAVVMAAGSGNEYAGALPGEERPAFSYLALGALRGWGDANGDGKITAEEVIDYSKMTLRTLLSGNRSQTPELAGGSYSTELGVGTEKGPDLGDLLLKLKSQQ